MSVVTAVIDIIKDTMSYAADLIMITSFMEMHAHVTTCALEWRFLLT